MFDKKLLKLHYCALIAFAGAALTAITGFSTPAAATLCGVTIDTAWSATDANVTTSDTSFVACSTVSTFAGTRGSFDGDEFSITVEAIDGDTFEINISITDNDSATASSPNDIGLVLSDIAWFGMDGLIIDVIDNSIVFNNDFDVTAFTGTSITLDASGPFGASCGSPGCNVSLSLGTFDIIAKHVPEPGTLALFGFGLLGLGAMRRRRRTT